MCQTCTFPKGICKRFTARDNAPDAMLRPRLCQAVQRVRVKPRLGARLFSDKPPKGFGKFYAPWQRGCGDLFTKEVHELSNSTGTTNDMSNMCFTGFLISSWRLSSFAQVSQSTVGCYFGPMVFWGTPFLSPTFRSFQWQESGPTSSISSFQWEVHVPR